MSLIGLSALIHPLVGNRGEGPLIGPSGYLAR